MSEHRLSFVVSSFVTFREFFSKQREQEKTRYMWVSTDCLSVSPPLPHISPYRGHKTVTQFFGNNGKFWLFLT